MSRPAGIPNDRRGAGFATRLLGAALAGALLATLAVVAAGFALEALAPARHAAGGLRAFLAAGGWAWVPLWGAALAALRAMAWAPGGGARLAAGALAAGLAAAPLVLRPAVVENVAARTPRTAREKSRAILKWSYRSPAEVARILRLSRDPDPRVREQAVLALGVNLIVTDIERATPARPARYRNHPLRDSLRARLVDALGDPEEAVRAEAARGLWKAPATFGHHPAAAGTLAAVLDRAPTAGTAERLAWLALDAAAGAADPRLKAAAARFAAATSDSDLARAARTAAAAPRR